MFNSVFVEYTKPADNMPTFFKESTTLGVSPLMSAILKGSRIIVSTFKKPLIYLGNDKRKERKLIRVYMLSSKCVVHISTAIGI